MNESYITVHGYVAAAPIVRTVGEHTVANFRIGVTPRKLERSSGEWHDAETQWYSVSAWRTLGDNVARSLRKGDPVIVQGRLSARTWINAQHSEVLAHEIEATVVGHDLRRGFSTFAKTVSAVPAAAQASPAEQQTAPGDGVDDAMASAVREPVEGAVRADWNLPLQDAPGLAGVA